MVLHPSPCSHHEGKVRPYKVRVRPFNGQSSFSAHGNSFPTAGWNNVQDGANISRIADSDVSFHGVLLTGRESHGKIASIAGFDADELPPFAIPEI